MTAAVTAGQFHELARRGNAAGVSVIRSTIGMLRAPADGSRVVPWVLSDGTVDRMGDTISAAGWDTSAFRKNPVVLFGHDSLSPPIGRANSVRPDGTRLVGNVEFAGAEVYEFADTIFRMVKAGFIRAGSVGFIPLEWSFSNDKGRTGGIDFKRCELLEFSIVPVPANANALTEARAKGIRTAPLARWAEQALDERRPVSISRPALDELRRAAHEPSLRRSTPAERHAAARRHKVEAELILDGYSVESARKIIAGRSGR